MLTVKCSILILYYRMFEANRAFRIAVWFVGAYVVAWYLATNLGCILQCTPVSRQWDKTIPGRCLNVPLFLFVTSILNCISDVAIVILPLPIVIRLQMRRGRKIAVCCIFALGGIVVIAGFLRLPSLLTITNFDATCKHTHKKPVPSYLEQN